LQNYLMPTPYGSAPRNDGRMIHAFGRSVPRIRAWPRDWQISTFETGGADGRRGGSRRIGAVLSEANTHLSFAISSSALVIEFTGFDTASAANWRYVAMNCYLDAIPGGLELTEGRLDMRLPSIQKLRQRNHVSPSPDWREPRAGGDHAFV
jgi:hypothetical protein